ncbi:phage minor head protein [Bergeyella porcorum]|uniref:phage minor head protein n=1 Tax=Bergeyella porcorum TaxID=1735111 RepID=UPI002E1BF02E
MRPWNEFKREALMVVGESNRYLKTEYNTVVSGAQMSRMWQEIQRDKHIFPFVQFDVVKDGRTSDICSPLDKLIFEVDSPVLAYYFPPNHFNCRTRVRKLRNGVPSKNYTLPDIPTEFKNNAGMCPPAYKLLSNDKDKKPIRKECGEIFTEENRYIKNTPKEVLKIGYQYADRWKTYEKYKSDPDYYDVEFNSLGGVKATHKDHNFDEATGISEKHIQNLFFNLGHIFTLETENPKIEGKKIDGYLNNSSFDISVILGKGKNTIKRALNHSRGKGAENAILYFSNKESFDFERLKEGIDKYKGQTDYRFKNIIYIIENKIYYY